MKKTFALGSANVTTPERVCLPWTTDTSNADALNAASEATSATFRSVDPWRQNHVHRRRVCEFRDLLQLLRGGLVAHHRRVLERKHGDVLAKPSLHARIAPDDHTLLVAPQRVVDVAFEVFDQAAKADRVLMGFAADNPRVEDLLLSGTGVVCATVAYLPPLGRQGATAGSAKTIVSAKQSCRLNNHIELNPKRASVRAY